MPSSVGDGFRLGCGFLVAIVIAIVLLIIVAGIIVAGA